MAEQIVNVIPQGLFSLATIVVVSGLYYLVTKLCANRTLEQFYKSQPHAGQKPGQWFPSLRASLNSLFHNGDQVKEGYAKVIPQPYLITHPLIIILVCQTQYPFSRPQPQKRSLFRYSSGNAQDRTWQSRKQA